MNTTDATYQKLLGIITRECGKRDKRERPNPHRFAIMLEALDHAANNPKGLAYGLNNAFCGSLRSKLLRAAGVDPKSTELPNRESAWHRENY